VSSNYKGSRKIEARVLEVMKKKEHIGNMAQQYDILRKRMVDDQIRGRGVTDARVLSAMIKVERHCFVPASMRESAYEDYPLPIGHEQTISQPYIVALMTELCELTGNEKVLEIGTGSGYQAAILGECAKEVYTIERIPAISEKAASLLENLGYRNIHVITGNGYIGIPEQAPFDAIILTAAPSVIPTALTDQLADNGVIVAPEGMEIQELVRIRKKWGVLERERILYVRFVPMVD
jgi:protein-L-isoaspartate(D-aspartate) O-methyltransferase